MKLRAETAMLSAEMAKVVYFDNVTITLPKKFDKGVQNSHVVNLSITEACQYELKGEIYRSDGTHFNGKQHAVETHQHYNGSSKIYNPEEQKF